MSWKRAGGLEGSIRPRYLFPGAMFSGSLHPSSLRRRTIGRSGEVKSFSSVSEMRQSFLPLLYLRPLRRMVFHRASFVFEVLRSFQRWLHRM